MMMKFGKTLLSQQQACLASKNSLLMNSLAFRGFGKGSK